MRPRILILLLGLSSPASAGDIVGGVFWLACGGPALPFFASVWGVDAAVRLPSVSRRWCGALLAVVVSVGVYQMFWRSNAWCELDPFFGPIVFAVCFAAGQVPPAIFGILPLPGSPEALRNPVMFKPLWPARRRGDSGVRVPQAPHSGPQCPAPRGH